MIVKDHAGRKDAGIKQIIQSRLIITHNTLEEIDHYNAPVYACFAKLGKPLL